MRHFTGFGLAAILAMIAPVGAVEQNSPEALRACLQSKVAVTAAAINPGAYSGHNVEVSISNGLGWPIAGVRFSYQAYSEGRAVPWLKDDVSISVRGGIEPGETRQVSTTAFVPAQAPMPLIVDAQVLDVTDQFERQLIRDVRVSGWGDSQSDQPCE